MSSNNGPTAASLADRAGKNPVPVDTALSIDLPGYHPHWRKSCMELAAILPAPMARMTVA